MTAHSDSLCCVVQIQVGADVLALVERIEIILVSTTASVAELSTFLCEVVEVEAVKARCTPAFVHRLLADGFSLLKRQSLWWSLRQRESKLE